MAAQGITADIPGRALGAPAEKFPLDKRKNAD